MAAMSSLPDFSVERKEALPGIEVPSVLGGVSPLPQPDFQFADNWNYQYFVVLPMNQIKHYNHEVVTRIVHRKILNALGSFDPQAFPPIVESWGNPVSVCIKMICTKQVFDGVRAEVLDIYTMFGGNPKMLTCYQTSEAMQ